MRLIKIKPANTYKHVEFGVLKGDWQGREVYTPDGFRPVLSFEFIKRGASLRLSLGNGFEILCDPGHIIQTINGPKFAKDLCPGDSLVGYHSIPISVDVSIGPESDFYDIEIPAPHWYYTSGIISHNTLMLCNNATKAVLDGHNVLFITFELSTLKTALRIASNMTGVKLKEFYKANIEDLTDSQLIQLRYEQDKVRKQIKARAQFGKHGKRGDLAIYELPPDECSVDEIYGIIERNAKLRGWRPKIVIIDYLELMLSRRNYNNREGDYTRQKAISTEVRGLAKNEDVLVYTATQTNRSAITNRETSQPIDVDKSAESFGKNMPVDYVISMNQTEAEYRQDRPELRLWVAKNRNGPRFVAIHTHVDYNKMKIVEIS